MKIISKDFRIVSKKMLKFLCVSRLPTTSVTQLSAAWKNSSLRELSTSNVARFARFREIRLNPQRRPGSAPKAREELHPDQIPVRPAKDLWKALAFTAGIGIGTYTFAAVYQYEQLKKIKRDIYGFFTEFFMEDTFGQTFATNRIPLTPGQKIAFAIIGLNGLVTLIWRVPRVQAQMYRYFTNSFASKSLCSPMLLSVFSHNNFIHLAVNMYVLYSFCPVSINRFLGVEQFIALYLTAGVFSSFTSLVHKSVVRSNIRALGASGAICALLTYTCMKIPDAKLSIIFLPFIQFSAENAVYGIILFDLIGLVFKFKLFDHAAHLGGSLFGVLYAMYGEDWIRNTFNPKIHKLCAEVER